MVTFDTLIGDASTRFGLGTKAGPLVREILNMIANAPGGIGGFLQKFESVGLRSEMESWLGHPNAAPISAQDLDRALGSGALGGIASRLGLGESAVKTAVGYTLPKLIGALTPGGKIPTRLPSEVETFLSSRVAEPGTRGVSGSSARRPSVGVFRDESSIGRWAWPLLGGLAVLGIGAYLYNRAPDRAPVASTAHAPAVRLPAAEEAHLPRLAINNDQGVIRFSGAVHDEETRASLINSLKAVFGADKIQGDITIDPNRGALPWLSNFRTALESLKAPGVQTVFEGNSVNLGGIIGDAERDKISNSLKSALGSGVAFGTLANKVTEAVSDANAKVAEALTSLKTGFGANDLTGLLNQSTVNFPSGGAEVPGSLAALLEKAASQIKQLPTDTVLEIAGYTDNTGDPAAALALSQQRADAVRNVLVRAGVDPSRVVAKGYASAKPSDRNRSIEYRVRS